MLIIKQKNEVLHFSVLEIENFVKNLPMMSTETNFIFQKIQEIKLLFIDGHQTGFFLLVESPKKKVFFLKKIIILFFIIQIVIYDSNFKEIAVLNLDEKFSYKGLFVCESFG